MNVQGHQQYIEAEVSSSTTSTTPSTSTTTEPKDSINSNAKDRPNSGEDSALYDDIVQHGDDVTSIGSHFLGVEKSSPSAQAQMMSSQKSASPTTSEDTLELADDPVIAQPFMVIKILINRILRYQKG